MNQSTQRCHSSAISIPSFQNHLSPVIPERGYRESKLTFLAEARVLKSKWIPANGMRE
ncbi:hypothetical protein [Vreelandella venusta]|uniref:Uncharacterized protein n=1 Tax=Vreelandella venusta TaxID=44935 RepID=A0AAQ0CHU8_9GAMM|nr:hypothetical protein [Halomonas venusta]QRL04718.1 hypothetical protein JDS37_07195 [Halomonas venusta]